MLPGRPLRPQFRNPWVWSHSIQNAQAVALSPPGRRRRKTLASRSGPAAKARGLGFVSLFPPTHKNTPNGLRPDIMQMFADMKAKFLPFPGGNYVEGDNLENRWNWKIAVGPIEERPGHWSPWGYWSSDGLGLLEYLEWCEDLDMEPVMAVYSGCKSVPAGEQLVPYVQDALDQIEYTTGDAKTKWGRGASRTGIRRRSN